MGIVGLVAARMGADVALTDRRPLLSLLRGNAARNWLAGVPDPRWVIVATREMAVSSKCHGAAACVRRRLHCQMPC